MRFTLERLEQRCLLATIAWEQGVVTVLGTAGNEAIVAEIEAEYLVFSGSETRIPISEVTRLDVQLLDGNDSFTNDTPFPATIDGGAGDDTLLGGDGPDELRGGPGADRLEGRLGDDRLDGGGEAQDQMFGGDGIDVIAGVTVTLGAGQVLTVRGTAATEEIRVLNVGNYLRIDGAEHTPRLALHVTRVEVYLGDGDDHFTNESNRLVQVWGEAGDDILTGKDRDLVDGGTGHNVLQGSDQLSRIEWSDIYGLILEGTEFSDRLILQGTYKEVYLPGMTTRWTNPGIVVIRGLAGHDRLINLSSVRVDFYGGEGSDVIISGRSPTEMYGDEGNDYLSGSAGNDKLSGGTGNDRLIGGSGDDIYLFATAVDSERDGIWDNGLTGSRNYDTLDFSALTDDIMLTFDGERGLSRELNRTVSIHGSAAEKILGGSGNDLLNSHAHTVSISGGTGNDQIIGNSFPQTLSGEDGNDEIFGGGGNNFLTGGDGNDRLVASGSGTSGMNGGAGDDWIQGSDSKNLVFGEDGNDIIYGGPLADELYGGEGDDQIFGLAGNDLIHGHEGMDRLDGGEGNDEIWGTRPPFITRDTYIPYTELIPNILLGGPGDDELHGSSGPDHFSGGQGIDTIYGYDGDDTLIDGADDDGDQLDSIEIFPPGY